VYVFQELGELGLLYYNCLFVSLPIMLIALAMGEYEPVMFVFLPILMQLAVIFTELLECDTHKE